MAQLGLVIRNLVKEAITVNREFSHDFLKDWLSLVEDMQRVSLAHYLLQSAYEVANLNLVLVFRVEIIRD